MTALPFGSASLRPTAARYWNESRLPLASLIFITPLLVIYEAGVLALGADAVRNGVDDWLRQLLDRLGFSQYFLLPALTVSILLAWHYLTRRPWRLSGGVFYGMIGECALLAICLRLFVQLQGILMETLAGTVKLNLASLTACLGAGVYEELLFRLLLVPLLIGVLRLLRLRPAASMAGAVLLSSLVFAAAHHIPPYGETFSWFSFSFRILAGIFFAVLFVYRGFGIAAGTHAGYDLLVGLARF
jgi:hypothetical protein